MRIIKGNFKVIYGALIPKIEKRFNLKVFLDPFFKNTKRCTSPIPSRKVKSFNY